MSGPGKPWKNPWPSSCSRITAWEWAGLAVVFLTGIATLLFLE